MKKINYLIIGIFTIGIMACNSDIKDMTVVFENQQYDLSNKKQFNLLVSELQYEGYLKWESMENVEAQLKSYKSGEYIMLTGLGITDKGYKEPFAIPFKQ